MRSAHATREFRSKIWRGNSRVAEAADDLVIAPTAQNKNSEAYGKLYL